jgi:hypothetical protein
MWRHREAQSLCHVQIDRQFEQVRARSAHRRVAVQLRPKDRDMPLLPRNQENFNPGYLMPSIHLLPKRGDKSEWQHTQDYWTEKDEFRAIDNWPRIRVSLTLLSQVMAGRTERLPFGCAAW